MPDKLNLRARQLEEKPVLLWPNRPCQESAQDSGRCYALLQAFEGDCLLSSAWCSNASSVYSSEELGMVAGKSLIKARNKTGPR